jgi:hypothetical protein
MFGPPPPDCDSELFGGGPPSVLDGHCRCLACGRCGHHSASAHQGHHSGSCMVTGTMREPHFCCPDPAWGCELEAASARPSPAELWEKSGGNRDRYRGLLREHGHILAPGDDGYDENAPRTLPCGWSPAR